MTGAFDLQPHVRSAKKNEANMLHVGSCGKRESLCGFRLGSVVFPDLMWFGSK